MNRFWLLLKSFSYPFGAFQRGTYGAFVNALLPLYIARFTHNTALIGFLVSISAFQGAIAPLLIGPLSDRTTAKMGRRKVYFFWGTIATCILLLLFPLAQSLPLLIVFIILAAFANNIPGAPQLAMITLNSKKEARAQMVALIGVCFLLGQVVFTVLSLTLWSKSITSSVFVWLSVLFFLPCIPFLIYSRDEKSPVGTKQNENIRSILSFFTNRQRNIYMSSQFVLWFGLNSVIPFFTLFITVYLHFSQHMAILFYLVIILTSGGLAYPFAMLGRRWTDSKVFCLGLGFLFIAAMMGIFAKELPEFLLFFIAFFAGAGDAVTNAFSYAIFSKIVPEEHIGLAGGVQNFLMSGFAPISGFFSGLLIGVFSYPSMFVVVSFTTIASIVLIRKSRVV